MAVSFSTFVSVVPMVVVGKNPYPVMLRGRHGIGKSCVVYQTADRLTFDEKTNTVKLAKDGDKTYPVIERRASQMTEGDLIGLPIIDGNVTKWNPPDWLKMACDRPVLLFIDEIDRAVNEVRQGFFELTDSRKIHGQSLHPGTVVFAAVNGGEHGSQYTVNEMDPAELDRWTCFDVEPTVEDWLNWANSPDKAGNKNVCKVVWDYINQNHNYLEETSGNFEPNRKYPSRRSWDRFSQRMTVCGLTDDAKANANVIFTLGAGFVGTETAMHFADFCRNYERQVNVADILDKGNMALVKDFGVNDHNAMVEKLCACDRFCDLTDPQLDNLTKYFKLLPSEVAMKLFYGFTKIVMEKQKLDLVKGFHARVKTELVKLLGTVDKDKESK